MQIDITKIIVAVIGLCVLVVTGFIIPYIKAKTNKTNADNDATNRTNIKAWVKVAVEAAEMIFKTPGAGAEKLEYVMNYMTELLKKKGIVMNDQEIRMAIESAVLELKKLL